MTSSEEYKELLWRLDERVRVLEKLPDSLERIEKDVSEITSTMNKITERVNGGFYVLLGLGGLVTWVTGVWQKIGALFK
jgi:hypothetical protein